MKPVWIVVGVVVGVIVLVALIVGGTFVSQWNKLVALDTDIKAAWAQVENQLQRRNDLIPNLVESVKGFAAQEKSIMESIANARAKMAGAGTVQDRIAASNDLSSALSRLLVVVENYPQLKSDRTFTQLMDELAGTENRLAVERKRYNDAVREYNRTIAPFPGRFIAPFLGFTEKPFFEAPPAARQAPQVKF
jgi:LemA protein